jgi:hypothetical protein
VGCAVGKDLTLADFCGTVSILKAVFHIPPGYTGSRMCTAFRNYKIKLTNRSNVFSALLSSSFVRIICLDI